MLRVDHEIECMEQPDEWPCICDEVKTRKQEAYNDAMIDELREESYERNKR